MTVEYAEPVEAEHRRRARLQLLRDPGHLLALGFGTGLAPLAPGTWGSLLGILPAWLIHELPLVGQFGVVLLLFAVGVPLCQRTAVVLASPDPSAIVLDEIIAVILTLIFCSQTIFGFLIGFLAFRFFDIAKPWPINLADRHVDGGFGIMLDDLIAAGYAILSVKIIEYFS